MGKQFCIGCGNGLDAIILNLKALEISFEDEVIASPILLLRQYWLCPIQELLRYF